MAWTAPPTYTAGAILTAAQMNAISANLFAGGPVYATYAALIADIPSPFEGQRAYITGPVAGTVTATGATTYVPSGINVVYNGTGWVCTTEVGAFTAAGGTYSTGSWGTTLVGTPGTNPSVTLLTGATALVTLNLQISVSTTMTANVDVAISGATTRAAGTTGSQSLNWAKSSDAGLAQTVTHTFIVDGLTAGVNTFTMSYFTNNTATFTARRLTAKGIA
jgi:hypothetical protein